ncbi:MAG: methionyl-tRNA formyltransferase [Bacteroidales bacterium]|jgi:methionyl-tRNA formyltransferase|nr:methionyl-tRNA formyltransferase [Bacteroidales bacterium]
MKIVFMGTPPFAVSTLEALHVNGFNVVAAVTAPDKPAGRGRKIQKPAVKEFAELNNIPVLQPVNLKDAGFISSLRALGGDIFIVVAFRMLPREVWEMPPLGTVNLHASLLPDYRGAAPINHAIINGETETGVTTFLIDERIDTGNILLRETLSISPSENAGTLHDRLAKTGAQLVVETLRGISDGSVKPQDQALFMAGRGTELKAAPKIFPKDCVIDWNSEAAAINNLVRGLSPLPGARSVLRNEWGTLSFKILECIPKYENHSLMPGTIVTDERCCLRIACKDGFVDVTTLQAEGRNRMSAAEFLKGFRIDGYTAVG